MNNILNIRSKAIPYIVLQRTNYLNRNFEFLPNFFKRIALMVFGARVKKRYSHDMMNEYESIKGKIPNKLVRVLDIGCGLAGIDALLYKMHGSPQLVLLDKTQIDSSIHYGFEKEGSYYNSLELAKELLVDNGVPSEKITVIDIRGTPPEIKEQNFDLIISLISWGFHYPVSTYSRMVYQALSSSGVLILDVRKDTNGEKVLMELFSIEIIKDFGKYIRYVCRKKE